MGVRIPTDVEREELRHLYDPVKAHEYYMRTRKLKGRRRSAQSKTAVSRVSRGSAKDPRTGKTKVEISKGARARQRQELAEQIKNLEGKLKKLEELIREKESEERSDDRKGRAKKERAAKERDKPKTAAEKAKARRENEKYRDKNQQKLKNKAKDSKSGGGSSSKSKRSDGDGPSLSALKSLRTKVKGQIAVAKQKLAAL